MFWTVLSKLISFAHFADIFERFAGEIKMGRELESWIITWLRSYLAPLPVPVPVPVSCGLWPVACGTWHVACVVTSKPNRIQLNANSIQSETHAFQNLDPSPPTHSDFPGNWRLGHVGHKTMEPKAPAEALWD